MAGNPLVRGGPQRHDISGFNLPTVSAPTGASATPQAPIIVQNPPELQPSPNSPEFILSWSLVVAGNSSAALYTLDANNNVLAGAAMALPDNTRARIAGVIIEGETVLGTPILQFSIRADPLGQQRLRGWGGVNLPGRGGIVNVGIEPFTIVPVGSFFGGWVQNTDGAPHYASIMIQGWLL